MDSQKLADQSKGSLHDLLKKAGALATQGSVAAKTGITAYAWRRADVPLASPLHLVFLFVPAGIHDISPAKDLRTEDRAPGVAGA